MNIEKVIELLNEKIFICESNLTYMNKENIESPNLLVALEEQHVVYVNLKQEIETLIEEDKSRVG